MKSLIIVGCIAVVGVAAMWGYRVLHFYATVRKW